MNIKKYPITVWLAVIVSLIGLLLLAGPPPPTRAGQTLPSRNTPTPAYDSDDEEDDRPVGAYIELQVPSVPAGAWSAVQWQDSDGGWHAVEGWLGALDEGGSRRWWVAARDFGKGPFRWLITQGRAGSVLGISQSFLLPAAAGEIVQVTLSLE